MDPKLTGAHLLLSVLLFFVSNWIGKHSVQVGYMKLSVLAKTDEAPAFNFLYRAFTPVAFIVIVSAICYKLDYLWVTERIYLVVVYYFALRLLFNIAIGRALLLNWWSQFALIIVAVPASYFVYENIVSKRDFFMPSAAEVGSAIWVAVVVYVYQTFNNVRSSGVGTRGRKAKYLENRFRLYSDKYGEIISETAQTKKQEMLIYAVLIYEAFNRPKLYRIVENLLARLGGAKTLGVMQVTSDEVISDEESVRLGARKIVRDYIQVESELEARRRVYGPWELKRLVLAKYNPGEDYYSEVGQLYDRLIETYAPEEEIDWAEQSRKWAEQERIWAEEDSRRESRVGEAAEEPFEMD